MELDRGIWTIKEKASSMSLDLDTIKNIVDQIDGSESRGFDKAAVSETLIAKKLSPTDICTLVAEETAMYCLLGTGESAFMNKSTGAKQFIQDLLEAGIVPTDLGTANSDQLTIPQLMACFPANAFRVMSMLMPRMRHEGVPREWRGICSPLAPLLMRFLNNDPALAATIKSHYLANQQAIAAFSTGRPTVSAEQIFDTMARSDLSGPEEKAASEYLLDILLYSVDLHNPNRMITVTAATSYVTDSDQTINNAALSLSNLSL